MQKLDDVPWNVANESTYPKFNEGIHHISPPVRFAHQKSQPINRRLICTHYSAQELIIVVFSHCKLAMLYVHVHVHVHVHVRVRTSVRIPVFLYTRKLATCNKILWLLLVKSWDERRKWRCWDEFGKGGGECGRSSLDIGKIGVAAEVTKTSIYDLNMKEYKIWGIG